MSFGSFIYIQVWIAHMSVPRGGLRVLMIASMPALSHVPDRLSIFKYWCIRFESNSRAIIIKAVKSDTIASVRKEISTLLNSSSPTATETLSEFFLVSRMNLYISSQGGVLIYCLSQRPNFSLRSGKSRIAKSNDMYSFIFFFVVVKRPLKSSFTPISSLFSIPGLSGS